MFPCYKLINAENIFLIPTMNDGERLLSVEERARMADYLEEELKNLYKTLSGLSLVVDTISKKKRKDKIEYLIEEVSLYIKN